MRGNRHRAWALLNPLRSIPASAGEPGHCPRLPLEVWVYPRECGGTSSTRTSLWSSRGLSPRVRGNLVALVAGSGILWSIPASAGEPLASWSGIEVSRVYPRECGGTGIGRRETCPFKGLSPRVRGNLMAIHSALPLGRSIPASAGEPLSGCPSKSFKSVYPRECGGTPRYQVRVHYLAGLSPRVRGNLTLEHLVMSIHRSIPASAGEPDDHRRDQSGLRVYPRECGGTRAGCGQRSDPDGLSPRVRGNLRVHEYRAWWQRSIPASAGEPCEGKEGLENYAVYPRECGGTSPRLGTAKPV